MVLGLLDLLLVVEELDLVGLLDLVVAVLGGGEVRAEGAQVGDLLAELETDGGDYPIFLADCFG